MARISGPTQFCPVDPGVTGAVTGATLANPCVVTCPNHNLVGSCTVILSGGTGEWAAANGEWGDINGDPGTVIDANHISIPLDSSAFAAFTGQVVTFQTYPAGGISFVEAGPWESSLNPGTVYAIGVCFGFTDYGQDGSGTQYFLCKADTLRGTAWTQVPLNIPRIARFAFLIDPPDVPYFDPGSDTLVCSLNDNGVAQQRNILTLDLDTGGVSIDDVTALVPPPYVASGNHVNSPYIHAVKLADGNLAMLIESQEGRGGHAATPPQVLRATGGSWGSPTTLTDWTIGFAIIIPDSGGNIYVISLDYGYLGSRTWSVWVQAALAGGSAGTRALVFDAIAVDPYYDLGWPEGQALILNSQLIITVTAGQVGRFGYTPDIWISNSLTDLTFSGIGSTLISTINDLGWAGYIRSTGVPTAQFQLLSDGNTLWAMIDPGGFTIPDVLVAFRYLGGGNWDAPVYAMPFASFVPPGSTSASIGLSTALLSDGTMGVIAGFTHTGFAGQYQFPYYYNFAVSPGSIDLGPNLACGTVPDGLVGTPYNHAFPASGGTPPYEFFLIGGALPAGLTLNPSTGAVSGTPTTAGNFCFSVEGLDATLSIDCAAPPDATVAVPYLHIILITGGTTPYAVAIIAGSLPPGLTIDNGGNVTGTPTTVGVYTFTVQATDNSGFVFQQSCSITVNHHPLVTDCADTTANSQVIQGLDISVTGSQIITIFYGVAPYTVGISAGTLPPGISLDNTGHAHGVPTVAGEYDFTVQVTDSVGEVVTFPCYITVSPAGIHCNHCSFRVGVSESCGVIGFTGLTAPFTSTITSGFLPTGLTMDNNGVISGTPSGVPVEYCVGIQVVDAHGVTVTANCCIDLTLPPGPPVLVCPSDTAQKTIFYDSRVSIAPGGEAFPPLTFSIVAGSLPPGLTLDPTNGDISGIPTTVGGYTMQFHMVDSHGQTADITCGITVNAEPPLAFSCNSPQGGFIGAPYSHTLGASYGTPPYTFTLDTGALPTGLTLNSSGLISGTPTALGTFYFSPLVTDSLGHVDENVCSITITTVTISCNNPPQGIVGIGYSYRLFVVGGATPYTISVTSGSAPGGLTIANTGWITGTPTTAGTFVFTVQVTDAASRTAHTTCSIVVVDHPQNIANCCILIVSPFSLTCASPPQGSLLVPYSHQLSLVGSSPPYVITVTSGTLPPGLSVGPTGLISGTPVTPGTFTFTIRATDLLGDTATATCSIVIVAVKRSGAGLAWRFGPRYPRTEVERR